MAAETKLVLVAQLKDEASSGLKKLNGSVTDLGQGMKNAALAAAAITAGVVAFGASSVKAAQEQIKVEKQLAAVIESTGGAAGVTADEVKAMAASFQSVTNFGDEAILAGQNMLLTFTNIGEDVFPNATQTMLDMSQALGTDLAGQAVQLGKALNDPIAGISALSRVGVSFTEDQKAMIASMVEVGDIAGAQKVILDELAVEFGGSAEAAVEPMIQLQNAIGDVKEEVGRLILDAINPIAQSMVDWIDTMGGATGVLDFIKMKFEQWKPVLIVVAGIIGGIFLGAIIAATMALWAFMVPMIPFIALGAAVGAIIALIVVIIKNLRDVIPSITAAWELLKEKTAEVWQGIKDRLVADFEEMKAAITGALESIKNFFVNAWESMKSFLANVWENMKIIVQIALFVLLNMLTFGLAGWVVLFITHWEQIKMAVLTAWEGIKSFVQEGIAFVTEAVGKIVEPVISAFSAAFNGAKNAVVGAFGAIKGAVVGGINFVIKKINALIDRLNGLKNSLNKIPGVSIPNIPKVPLIPLAKGGIVTGPTNALIGEAGPEAVIPLKKAGGILGTTVNVTVNTGAIGSNMDVERMAQKVGDTIIKRLQLNLRV